MNGQQVPARVYFVFPLDINPLSTQKLLTECSGWVNGGVKEIHLLISSFGGNVASGISTYNVLRSLPIELHTYNMGNIDSIANILFLAGKVRHAVPHATFMFHGVGFDINGERFRADLPWLRDKLESINADHKKMASIINERAKFDRIDDIMALFAEQATKEAEWAKTHGIVDKVAHYEIPAGERVLVFSA
ncbi:MAG: ATP-dependent Clp protease proteolytic subunit [Planctomycetia bacterium]|nr:ATP-dependent Clp protease proteolytic subunit [Planctomycetia bacterium]